MLFIQAVASAPAAAADEAPPAPVTAEATVAAAAGRKAGAGRKVIRQSIDATVEQRAFLQDPRLAALGQPDWWLEFQADADWRLRLGDRFSLSVSPRVEWQENGGTADGFDFDDQGSLQGEAEAFLYRAEAAISLSEWGLDLLAGKLRPQAGVNYIEPLSVMNLRGRESYDEGAWLSGFLLSAGAFSLEAYGQTDSDPVLFSALSALLDIHELGVLYRRESGEGSDACHFFGTWYRGQIGEGLIPYGEVAFRTDDAFLDLDGQEAREGGGNWEALAGLGWSPAGVNLSSYLEYRWRQAGYDGDDWDRLGALGPREVGAYLPDFPYLQTARHALGLHLQSQDEVLGFLSWSATCVWLFPGLYTQAQLEASFVERCRIGLKAERDTTFGESEQSEAAFWPHEGRLTLYVNWKINAKEEGPNAL